MWSSIRLSSEVQRGGAYCPHHCHDLFDMMSVFKRCRMLHHLYRSSSGRCLSSCARRQPFEDTWSYASRTVSVDRCSQYDLGAMVAIQKFTSLGLQQEQSR